jgi:hypothetical protein
MGVYPPSRYQVNGLCEIAISQNLIEINVMNGFFGETAVSEIIARVDELSHGKKSFVLINFSKHSRINMAGLKVLSSNRALNYAKAKAYVLQSIHQRFMAFLYLVMKGKNKPIAFFGNRESANKWLKEQVIY